MKQFFRNWWIFILYLGLYFIAINVVTIIRFLQFETFYFDHSIFDRALWLASRFQPPLIDHYGSSLLNQLGDHFTPVMYLLAPLYWFTSSYTAILVMENIFVIGSTIVLLIIARRYIKSKLLLFTLCLSYTLFIGLQNAVIANFHTELPALLTLSLVLWAMDRKKWHFFWIFLLFTFGLKETFTTIGVGIGVYLLLIKQFKIGITTVVISLLYYWFVTRFTIPSFSHGPYMYASSVAIGINLITRFFVPLIKSETLLVSFFTFGLLPFFNRAFLPVILLDYFVRFVVSDSPARSDLGLHYNTLVSVLLVYGSILGIKYLFKTNWYPKIYKAHALGIILMTLFFHYKYHGPLGLFYNKVFYQQTKNLDFLRNFLNQIPPGGRVMTQNNLGPHLTHTHEVILLRNDYWLFMPDTIAFDSRDGQNANNYWPMLFANLKELKSDLERDPNYEDKSLTVEQKLFVKKNSVDMTRYENRIK